MINQNAYDQPTNKPTKKVQAGAAGSSAAAVVIGAANEIGIDLSWLTDKPILFGLLVTAVGFVAGYIKRESA